MKRIWIPSAILACIIAAISFEHIYAQDRGANDSEGTTLEIEASNERFIVVTSEITRVENEDGRENPPTARRVDTVLLDTWSGKTWRLNYSKSGSYKWEEIPGKREEIIR